jgi:hypothetical protein
MAEREPLCSVPKLVRGQIRNRLDFFAKRDREDLSHGQIRREKVEKYLNKALFKDWTLFHALLDVHDFVLQAENTQYENEDYRSICLDPEAYWIIFGPGWKAPASEDWKGSYFGQIRLRSDLQVPENAHFVSRGTPRRIESIEHVLDHTRHNECEMYFPQLTVGSRETTLYVSLDFTRKQFSSLWGDNNFSYIYTLHCSRKSPYGDV